MSSARNPGQFDIRQIRHLQGLGTGSQCPCVSFPAVLKAPLLKKLQEPVIWGPQVRGDRWQPLLQAQQSQGVGAVCQESQGHSNNYFI